MRILLGTMLFMFLGMFLVRILTVDDETSGDYMTYLEDANQTKLAARGNYGRDSHYGRTDPTWIFVLSYLVLGLAATTDPCGFSFSGPIGGQMLITSMYFFLPLTIAFREDIASFAYRPEGGLPWLPSMNTGWITMMCISITPYGLWMGQSERLQASIALTLVTAYLILLGCLNLDALIAKEYFLVTMGPFSPITWPVGVLGLLLPIIKICSLQNQTLFLMLHLNNTRAATTSPFSTAVANLFGSSSGEDLTLFGFGSGSGNSSGDPMTTAPVTPESYACGDLEQGGATTTAADIDVDDIDTAGFSESDFFAIFGDDSPPLPYPVVVGSKRELPSTADGEASRSKRMTMAASFEGGPALPVESGRGGTTEEVHTALERMIAKAGSAVTESSSCDATSGVTEHDLGEFQCQEAPLAPKPAPKGGFPADLMSGIARQSQALLEMATTQALLQFHTQAFCQFQISDYCLQYANDQFKTTCSNFGQGDLRIGWEAWLLPAIVPALSEMVASGETNKRHMSQRFAHPTLKHSAGPNRPLQFESTLLLTGQTVSWLIHNSEDFHLLAQPSFEDDIQFLSRPKEDIHENTLDSHYFDTSFSFDNSAPGSSSSGKGPSESEDGGPVSSRTSGEEAPPWPPSTVDDVTVSSGDPWVGQHVRLLRGKNMGLVGHVLKKVNKKYRVKVQGAMPRPPKRRGAAGSGKVKKEEALDEEGYAHLEYFPDNFELLAGPNAGMWIDESNKAHTSMYK